MSELLDILEARAGIVCAVGAGGKKTTLYRLAAMHPGRVGVTATVPIARFPRTLRAETVIADVERLPRAVVDAAARHRRIAFALPEVKKARYGGLPGEILRGIRESADFDCLLVKADGARMRWIKAPDDSEPLIPAGATTVLPVISARSIGEPLSDRIAHRPSKVEAVTGAGIGEPLSTTHVARLLASPDGALRNVGDAMVVPILNMVDSHVIRAVAERAARQALDLTDRFDRVVLTSAERSDPLVQVITR